MAQTTVVIPGIVEGCTVYADEEIVARDENVTLPEVNIATYTQKLPGGEQDMPSSKIEDMETTISKNGLNNNAIKYINAENIEVRWAQNEIASDGTVSRIGYKAFMLTRPITLAPGASIEAGSGIENDITKKVLSYQLYRDGEEIVNINKITGTMKIGDKNYNIDDSLL